jgi:Proteins of 100 residues with WXG
MSGDTNFAVDLQSLWDAYVSVGREHGYIEDQLSQIDRKMSSLSEDWNSPSFSTIDEMKTWFTKVSARLNDLLQEIVNRLDISYRNYHQAESANLSNLTNSGVHDKAPQVYETVPHDKAPHVYETVPHDKHLA